MTTLPQTYLAYPNRRYGMDDGRHEWQPLPGRAKLTLPGQTKTIATIVVPLEFFPLNPPAQPFKHPGAMVTPYPDLRHFTARDYGNRVGVYRLLELFDAFGIRATFAVNAEIARRFPPLLDAVRKAGHEIAAHGVSTADIHHSGLAEDAERALVEKTRALLPDAISWMSPARNESFRTPDLIAEAGFTICLDWEVDMRPRQLRTKVGRLVALPNYSELSDFRLLVERSQPEDTWADQLIEAALYHITRYDIEGASAFAFVLTPYIAGLPFRIQPLKRSLEALCKMDGLRLMTARESVQAFGETP